MTILGRCGNCMEPHSYHHARREAPPVCASGGEVYREASDEELAAGYAAAFPDGPKPIATFRTDVPEEMEELKRLFGPGGKAFERTVPASVKNDGCHPDDQGQDYIDCPNCAAGRVYSLECDCCGWVDGEPKTPLPLSTRGEAR